MLKIEVEGYKVRIRGTIPTVIVERIVRRIVEVVEEVGGEARRDKRVVGAPTEEIGGERFSQIFWGSMRKWSDGGRGGSRREGRGGSADPGEVGEEAYGGGRYKIGYNVGREEIRVLVIQGRGQRPIDRGEMVIRKEEIEEKMGRE